MKKRRKRKSNKQRLPPGIDHRPAKTRIGDINWLEMAIGFCIIIVAIVTGLWLGLHFPAGVNH